MTNHESGTSGGGLVTIEMSRGAKRTLLLLTFLGAVIVVLGLGWQLGRRPDAAAAPSSAAQAPAAPTQPQAAAPAAPAAPVQDFVSRPAGIDVPIGDNPRLALPELVAAGYTIDFGEAPVADGPVSASVVVRNDGVKDLMITDVQANCSCTSAYVKLTIVPPGGETQLVVTHDPEVMMAHGSTDVNHQLTIASNDPAAPQVAVDLRGTIIP